MHAIRWDPALVKQNVRPIGWTLISAAAAAAVAVRADYTHYTWWAATEFALTAFLSTIDKDNRVAVMFLTQALFVILGVAIMSFMGCTMLRTVAQDLRWSYLPLNFIIHYGLFLAVYINPPRKPIANYKSQVVAGAGLFVTYALCNDPTTVYGCDLAEGIVPLVFTILAFILLSDKAERFALHQLGGFRNTVTPQ